MTRMVCLQVWELVATGLEWAWEQVRADELERAGLPDETPVADPRPPEPPTPAANSPSGHSDPESSVPSETGTGRPSGEAEPSAARSPGVVDAAIAAMSDGEGAGEVALTRASTGGTS